MRADLISPRRVVLVNATSALNAAPANKVNDKYYNRYHKQYMDEVSDRCTAKPKSQSP